PHHQSYDILNISGLLHAGKNTLAVRIHHQKGKYSYHHKGRAGLLAQLDFISDKKEFTVITDSNWKVAPDPSWDNEAPKINRFQQIVSDRVDMRKYLKGWSGNVFDDANWSNAKPLMRNIGWPSPQNNSLAQALTPPWTSLVPRDIPYLKEADVQAVDLIQAIEIEWAIPEHQKENFRLKPIKLTGQIDNLIAEGLYNYQEKKGALVIPGSDTPKTWLLLFDFGKVLNGMPYLDIEGVSGTMIDVLCAPFVVDNQFTHQIVDSDYLDRIILSGERDVWEATYFKPTRYMGIVIRNRKEAVKLHFAGIHQIEYPFQKKGLMQSSDAPWVKQYFEASEKTIQVCTIDGYTDNYRERRQYAQTGYYAALGNYWIFGDMALQRRYLIQVAQEQEANGMMPAYAPAASNDYMIIIDSNCLWIRSLHNYLLYSGDYKTTRELLPTAKKLMDLLHSYTNSLGLIDNPPYAYWLDHALNDRRGANFNLNGHYLGALEDFAQILEWLDEPFDEEFQKRANQLRTSLRTYLWDEDKHLFADALIDGIRSDLFSEHANAMALAMNVATSSQANLIAEQLLTQDQHNYIKGASGITMVTPAMSYFLHKGLCAYGYVDKSFRIFRERFDKMLQPDTNGTLWEEWWLDAIGRTGKLQKGRTRSDAQTESVFPPALFAKYLLGINPTQPG
ncbi:MAG: alpha-L-rhamnosidase N-terminal domain-containing protein, partial [Cyclobacteriaceae bacterium]|nr:alpha-L-rhamnosidase N-terminal domain-containing protein [Cyclobacteriaceae bacterium]